MFAVRCAARCDSCLCVSPLIGRGQQDGEEEECESVKVGAVCRVVMLIVFVSFCYVFFWGVLSTPLFLRFNFEEVFRWGLKHRCWLSPPAGTWSTCTTSIPPCNPSPKSRSTHGGVFLDSSTEGITEKPGVRVSLFMSPF